MNQIVALRVAVGVVSFAVGASLVTAHAAGLNHTSQNLTPYRTCTVTATPSTTTSVIDSWVQQDKGTTNNGTTTTMFTQASTSGNRRIYVRFDLSGCSPAIPSMATVRLATLRLWASAFAGTCRTLGVFRVGAAWTETGITWNNQPFGTTLNNPAMGSATATFNVGSPTGCQNRVAGYIVGGDMTADVAAFVAGSATNNGWMLRDSVEGGSGTNANTFSAKNLGTLAQAPQLIVTYVTAP